MAAECGVGRARPDSLWRRSQSLPGQCGVGPYRRRKQSRTQNGVVAALVRAREWVAVDDVKLIASTSSRQLNRNQVGKKTPLES